MNLFVEAMQRKHWPEVQTIYREGIATGEATFEATVPGWKEWDMRHRKDCRLVARDGNRIIAWAALNPVSDRAAYSGVAEVSIYVTEAARGMGVGKALLDALLRASESAGIWTLQAAIFPENITSIALHRNLGFREVGYRERIGRLNGRWKNVLLMERRSKIVGV